MRNLMLKLTCLSALVTVASCATPSADNCAGWRPVILLDDTAVYMNDNDPTALKAIIGNHEHGKASKCWR